MKQALAGLAVCGATWLFPKQAMTLILALGMHKVASYMHLLDRILHP